MSDLPKCKLCGADAAMHKVFGGIKYCCSSETCTMHDVLMLKNQWRTLMTQMQAEPVRWMYEDGSVGDIDCGHTCIPLYTAPPAQPAKPQSNPTARDWEMKAQGIESVIHYVVSKSDQDVLRKCAEDKRAEGIRAAKQAQPAPIPRNERMPALADADPFGMVAWWNSFDNFWVLTNWDSKPARPIFTHWRHTGLTMPPAPTNKDNTDAKDSD